MKSININTRILATFILFTGILLTVGCDKLPENQLVAEFSFELKGGNMVHFTSESEGDYYSAFWDFGNGQSETSTIKNAVLDIYYPEAGDYRVRLKITDYNGNNDTISKVVSIASTDLIISFSAVVDATNPNQVNLVNTSEGSYDSIIWKYRHREKENIEQLSAYFPFSGNHEIELELIKGTFAISSKKNILIDQDDPNYIENLSLTWADEFDGTDIDSDNWTFRTGSNGWGNNELQNYTNGNNAEIIDGILVLTAEKVDENQEPGSYTSTRMITKNKKEFTYGKMEVRAKLPSGRGIWPGIWTLGTNINEVDWPACGEIDIMEYVGYEPNKIHSTVHTPSGFSSNGNGSSKSLPTCEEEFHIYGALWTERNIVFYTDSIENITHTYAPSNQNAETWPFDLPQYFIFNVAVGGDWGGAQGIDNSIFPTSLEVDYIRVYEEQ